MQTLLRKAHPMNLALVAGCLFLAAGLGSEIARAAETKTSTERIDFFEKKVRPILVSHCYTCHSADTKPAGGLRVDGRRGLLTGGDSGPAVIPEEPEKSLLLQRVQHQDPKRRMPKGRRGPHRERNCRPDDLDYRRS